MSLWREDLLIVLAIGGYIVASSILGAKDFEDAQITAKHVEEAYEKRICDVTVAQYGPTERWHPKKKKPACAEYAKDLPPYLLTLPVAQ